MKFKRAISDLFPNVWGGYFALYEQISPPKWHLRTRCGGHRCRRSVQALARMLCHVPSIGSCSQFCLILQPHRIAVPFPPTFVSPWQNSFVQIHGATTLSGQNLGPPFQMTKNGPKLGGGVSYGMNKPLFSKPILIL